MGHTAYLRFYLLGRAIAEDVDLDDLIDEGHAKRVLGGADFRTVAEEAVAKDQPGPEECTVDEDDDITSESALEALRAGYVDEAANLVSDDLAVLVDQLLNDGDPEDDDDEDDDEGGDRPEPVRLEDFFEVGKWDCEQALDLEYFGLDALARKLRKNSTEGSTSRNEATAKAVDGYLKAVEGGEGWMASWEEQNEEALADLATKAGDREKAYATWKDGWRAYAERTVRNELEERLDKLR